MGIHREDALVWSLKAAHEGAIVTDLLADALLIERWFDGKLTPVAGAIAALQKLRTDLVDQEPLSRVALIDQLESVIANLFVEGDKEQAAETTAAIEERDAARGWAVRLEQELADAEQHLEQSHADLIKGVLLDLKRFKADSPAESRAVALAVRQTAEKFGVTL